MKNVVLDEVKKNLGEQVYNCMKNICKYYKKDFRKVLKNMHKKQA